MGRRIGLEGGDVEMKGKDGFAGEFFAHYGSSGRQSHSFIFFFWVIVTICGLNYYWNP